GGVIWGRWGGGRPAVPGRGVWHRLAMFVMRRPAVVAVSVVALLLVLGAPFLRVNFGLPDDRVLPATASSRQVQDAIRTNFASDELNTLPIVAFGVRTNDPSAVAAYAAQGSLVNGVAAVRGPTGAH